jgi:hypothetical protein
MRFSTLLVLTILALAGLQSSLQAQVLLNSTNVDCFQPFTDGYSQTFDALPGSPLPPWTNNPAGPLVGWYISSPINYLGASTGSGITGGFYSYGSVALPTDRSFGMLTTGSFPTARIGLRLRNNSTAPIYSFSITYTGEQWRVGQNNNIPDQLTFEYLTGTNLTDVNTPTGWTAVTALDFIAPRDFATCGPGGAAQDGNNMSNRLQYTTFIDLQTPLLTGDEIMLRWTDTDILGCSDHGMAIDDLEIQPYSWPINVTNSFQLGPFFGVTDLCPGATTILSVSNDPNLTYDWNVSFPLILVSGQGTPTATIEVSPFAPNGVYQVFVSGSNVCGTGFPQETFITVGNGIPADAGPDIDICLPSNQVTIIGNDPAPGFATWTQIGGPPATLNPTGPQVDISDLNAPGIYEFEYTINRPGCPLSTDLVTVTVNQPPAGASVTPSAVTVCSPAVVLQADPPLAGTGTWNFVNGPAPATISTAGLNGTATGMTVPGVYTFEWELTNAGCPDTETATATVTVVEEPSLANAGTDVFVCDPTNVVLTGNVPAVGTPTWVYLFDGPSIPTLNPSGNVLTVSGLTLPGSYTFRYLIVNPPCTSTFDDVVIHVGRTPTQAVSAGTDQEFCGTVTGSITLVGSDPSPALGVWDQINPPFTGVSTVVNIGTVNGPVPPGVYEYRYRVIQPVPGTCPDLEDFMTVTVYDLPTPANAGADQTICNQSNALLIGNLPTVGTPQWLINAQPIGGAATLTVLGPNNALAENMLVPGVYRFEYRISNGICPPTSDLVDILVLTPTTTADAGPDRTVCQSIGSALLTGNALAAFETGTWSFFNGPTTPTLNQTGTDLFVTGLTTTGCYTFRWTISKPSCSSSEDFVDVCVVAPPSIANAFGDQTLCNEPGAFVIAEVPTVGTGTWSIISSPGPATIATSGVEGTVTGPNGVYVLRWTVSNPPCADSFQDIQLTLVPPTPPSNAGLDQSYCLNSITSINLQATVPAVGTGFWQAIPGNPSPVTISDPTLFNTAVTGFTAVGTYRFEWVIFNPPCAFSRDTMAVVITQPSVAGTITSSTLPVCAGDNTVNINLIGSIGSVLAWQTSTNNFSTFATLPSTSTSLSFTNLTAGFQLRALVRNGTCNPETTATFLVQVVSNPIGGSISYTPSGPSTCSSVLSGQLKLNGYAGTILRWEAAPNSAFSSPTTLAVTTPIYSHGTLTQTTCFRAVVGNGTCPITYSQPYCVNVSGLGVLNATIDAGCNGLSTVFAQVTGGASPHDFYLVPSAGVTYERGIIINVPPGNYTLYARDANYCYLTLPLVVSASPVPAHPRVTSISPLTSSRAVVRWTPVPQTTGVRYNFRIATNPLGPWTSGSTLGLQRNFTGLLPNTTYYVQLQTRCLSNPNVFSTWSPSTVFTTLSLREEELVGGTSLAGVSVYPNPSRGVVSLQLDQSLNGALDLEVVDLTGRRVFNQRWEVLESANTYQLDLTHLASGVYLLNMRQGQDRRSLKLIIE